jgi:UPF0246 protein SSA_1395
MKILIPSAKELNETARPVDAKPLSSHTQKILQTLKDYRLEDLASFYGISEERAQVEKERIEALVNGSAKTFLALELFDGLMYRSIQRQDLSKKEQAYLQEHLLITTALYGVIPAYEGIAPHRLDFMMKLKPDGQSLKALWREEYDRSVEEEEQILSLLSSEFEMVFSKTIRDRMIRIKFMENRGGKLKVHSTISKKARGAMVTAMMKAGISQLEDLKLLEVAGFSYREDLSQEQEWVFVKE